MKSLAQQISAMKKRWPKFKYILEADDRIRWFGPLAGHEVTYRIMIEYTLPKGPPTDPSWQTFPAVTVLSPRLRPKYQGCEEAPLPHVYFDQSDITFSTLCLFDPDADEWSHDDLIANTIVPWAADWLACYEAWLATGKWLGGGRHAIPVPGEKSFDI